MGCGANLLSPPLPCRPSADPDTSLFASHRDWIAAADNGRGLDMGEQAADQLRALRITEPQRRKVSTFHCQSSPKSGESAIIESTLSPTNLRLGTLAASGTPAVHGDRARGWAAGVAT